MNNKETYTMYVFTSPARAYKTKTLETGETEKEAVPFIYNNVTSHREDYEGNLVISYHGKLTGTNNIVRIKTDKIINYSCPEDKMI